MQLAKNGLGSSRPNPSVGAVIVYKNKIIGEGFTATYGSNHAEVNAVNSVQNKAILKKATLFVTLEPCAHFGKTPPCADLLVKHQFRKVVIGCLDTNKLVAGKGIERLIKGGIEVVVGVLEDECKWHHRRFFTYQEKQRPYIILKWAATKDGFIAPDKQLKKAQKPFWISNKFSQQLVHKWRSEEQAILVGTNTVLADNPKLNTRNWGGKSPVRIVLDRTLKIPEHTHVYQPNSPTIFLTDKKNLSPAKSNDMIFFETLDFTKNVADQVCAILYKHQIQSVIIEGGTLTLQTFIDANLWDETRVFTADMTVGTGVKAPVFLAKHHRQQKIKNDILKTYYND